MIRVVEFEVPFLPPMECSPNWRGHWAQRSVAAQRYRHAVAMYGRQVTGADPVPFVKARLDLTVVFRSKQIRDDDNMRARFKPGQDGIVDLGLLEDDDPAHLEMGSLDIVVEKDRAPLTIIKLTEIEESRIAGRRG